MSLWKKNKFVNENSPQLCTQTKSYMYQRASFCTRGKGSLTIEASVVIPLVIGFLATILFFFRIIQVQSKVEEALMYAARAVAVESSMVTSDVALLASAEVLFLSMLEDSDVDLYVKNGVLGISLLQSELNGENIQLHAEYAIQLPVYFFGMKQIHLSSENCCRKWVGDGLSDANGEWVFVTPNGKVYHLVATCRALDIKIMAASYQAIEQYRGKNGQKYYCCSRCKKEDMKTVYYTEYGRLYHANMKCSALKRTIQKIHITEIGGRRGCAFCYGL